MKIEIEKDKLDEFGKEFPEAYKLFLYFMSRPERSKREDSCFVEFGCSVPVRFNTSKGVKRMEPGKIYDQSLNEI